MCSTSLLSSIQSLLLFPPRFSSQFDPAVKTIPVVRVLSGRFGRAVGEGRQNGADLWDSVPNALHMLLSGKRPSVSHPRGKRPVSKQLGQTAQPRASRNHNPTSVLISITTVFLFLISLMFNTCMSNVICEDFLHRGHKVKVCRWP